MKKLLTALCLLGLFGTANGNDFNNTIKSTKYGTIRYETNLGRVEQFITPNGYLCIWFRRRSDSGGLQCDFSKTVPVDTYKMKK